MEGNFINKQTLANLNSELVKNIDVQNKTRGDKKMILEKLLGNMKKVYQKLDKTKINEKNFNKIFETFSKYSVINTINELKPKTEHFSQPKEVNVGPMAYNRDRDVAPTTTVKYLDRPQSTYSVKENYYDINRRNETSNVQMHNNFDDDMRTPKSSRYMSNVAPEKAMEELLSERQMLTPDVQRPSTPDFLKSKQVKNAQKAESINTPSPSQNLNFSNEINQDVKMKGDTYHLSGANLDSNYGSIDFGNNELTSGLPDVDETIDTNQRLEMLQQERSRDSNFSQNMDINSNIPKPDFSKSIEENERQMRQLQSNIKQESQIQNSQKEMYQNKTMESVTSPNTGNIVDKLNNMNTGDIMNLLNSYAKNNSKNNIQPETPNHPRAKESYDSGSEVINKYLNDLSQKQFEQMKQVQILQEQLQENLKNQMLYNNGADESSKDNDALKNELISKVKILTGQLEQEKKINFELRTKLDETLSEKENENDLKLKLIEQKKEEIRNEVINIGTKNSEIESSYKNLVIKENFIKGLIQKNLKILKSDKYTTLISSKSYGNSSEFNFNLINPLIGVTKLELLSYDLPTNTNNIDDSNNKFYFKFNEENSETENKQTSNDSDSEMEIHESEDVESFEIPNGNYDISTLIKKLNKVGKPYNITFSYNKNTSKVTVKSEKAFNLYKKESSILNILGLNEDEYINELSYIGNNSYDLRKSNYAYLYINNINEEKPFGTLNISGAKNSYYYTDLENVNVSNLEISLRNEDGTLIDFCNLPFTLELRFIYTNEQIIIDDSLDSESKNTNEVEIEQ